MSTAAKPQNTTLALLETKKASFASVLPKHINPDAFMRKVLFSCSKTPGLLQCSPLSVMSAFLEAAQLGIDPTGLLGEGYMIPFKGEAKFMLGYLGMVNLARRSGELASIRARAVYDGDKFHVEYGLIERLEHVPKLGVEHSDKTLRFVYTVITLRDGTVSFDVMSKAEVDIVRASSRAGSSGPWVQWYEQMALKTVVKRGLKLVPKSAELERALAAEAAFENDDPDPATFDIDIEGPQSKADKIKAKIAVTEVLAAATQPAPSEDRQPGQEG